METVVGDLGNNSIHRKVADCPAKGASTGMDRRRSLKAAVCCKLCISFGHSHWEEFLHLFVNF